MLAIRRFELLFEMQDSLIELRVINLLFLKGINKHGFVGLLSMSVRLLKIRSGYYKVMRSGLIKIDIQRPM
jgi:hypothetical protein